MAFGSHALESAPPPSSAEVPARAKPLTCANGRGLGQRRQHGRALAACLLADGIATAAASQETVARHLGVDRSAVAHWATVDHVAAVALGDVLAMPPAVALAVLHAAIAEIEAAAAPTTAPLPELALRLSAEAGDVARAIHDASADGKLEPRELRVVMKEIGDVERIGPLMRQAARRSE